MLEAIHIFVVEDEPAQRELLVAYLNRQGFVTTGLADGAALREMTEAAPPALVLLDLNLPGESGLSLARHLRETWPRIGIIMVTAAGETDDRVVGLETGADDYIPKPFDPGELLARVKSVLRRTEYAATLHETQDRGASASNPIKVPMGKHLLDRERRVLLTETGGSEPLAPGEFDLLKVFAENPNRPLSREFLVEATSYPGAGGIDLRITRLRRKIEVDPTHPDTIRTVRSGGYMFVPRA